MKRRMSKRLVLILSMLLAMGLLLGCGAKSEPAGEASSIGGTKEEAVELYVFAAASMTETLTEIKELYEKEHENVTIIYNFDSSGTLKTQIEEGADCDLFISAGQMQMEGFDVEDTKVDLLENKVALVVPEGNPKGIQSFEDLVNGLKSGEILMAMGNSDVPVGQYTQRILTYFGLDEETLAAKGVLTYGTNVKEVTTQVVEGSVDCGIVYCTDAKSANLTVVDVADADMCGQVIYPAAVMENAKHPDVAADFLTFLSTDACKEIFEAVGFTAL